MRVPEKVSPAIIAPPSPRRVGSERVIGISPMIVARSYGLWLQVDWMRAVCNSRNKGKAGFVVLELFYLPVRLNFDNDTKESLGHLSGREERVFGEGKDNKYAEIERGIKRA